MVIMTAKDTIVGSDIRGPHEIGWAQGQPHPVLGQRPATPLPRPHDVVLYRANDWGPLVEATVIDVNTSPGHPNMGLPQPWPELRLLVKPAWPAHKLDAAGHALARSAGPLPYYVLTIESRLDGSAGWLPLDHEMRAYPPQGV